MPRHNLFKDPSYYLLLKKVIFEKKSLTRDLNIYNAPSLESSKRKQILKKMKKLERAGFVTVTHGEKNANNYSFNLSGMASSLIDFIADELVTKSKRKEIVRDLKNDDSMKLVEKHVRFCLDKRTILFKKAKTIRQAQILFLELAYGFAVQMLYPSGDFKEMPTITNQDRKKIVFQELVLQLMAQKQFYNFHQEMKGVSA